MVQTLVLVGAGVVLLLTVGVGIGAHELSHAAGLYCFGIQCDITIGPEQVRTGQFGSNVPGAWAAVTPREMAPGTTAWALRVSSIAPLLLAAPFVAVITGIVPDPVQADSLLLNVWAVGWLACALPSPQDFSVFWHAERLVAEHSTESTEG